MVDFLGQELHIGDNVVYYRHQRRTATLIKTKIVGFTDKLVKLESGSWGNVWPDKLIKYNRVNIDSQQKLRDIVDDALSELDEICEIDTNIAYNLYSYIYNLIANIYNRFIEE